MPSPQLCLLLSISFVYDLYVLSTNQSMLRDTQMQDLQQTVCCTLSFRAPGNETISVVCSMEKNQHKKPFSQPLQFLYLVDIKSFLVIKSCTTAALSRQEFSAMFAKNSGFGIRSFQKNATFLRSFPFFIKEWRVLCVLFRSL